MAGQGTVIGEYGVVADCTIVGDMAGSHYPVVVPHTGCAAASGCTAIDAAILADRIPVADLES